MRSLFQGHGHLTDPLEPRTPLSGRVSGLSNRKGTERAGFSGEAGGMRWPKSAPAVTPPPAAGRGEEDREPVR